MATPLRRRLFLGQCENPIGPNSEEHVFLQTSTAVEQPPFRCPFPVLPSPMWGKIVDLRTSTPWNPAVDPCHTSWSGSGRQNSVLSSQQTALSISPVSMVPI